MLERRVGSGSHFAAGSARGDLAPPAGAAAPQVGGGNAEVRSGEANARSAPEGTGRTEGGTAGEETETGEAAPALRRKREIVEPALPTAGFELRGTRPWYAAPLERGAARSQKAGGHSEGPAEKKRLPGASTS
jgi:hypothetical protein